MERIWWCNSHGRRALELEDSGSNKGRYGCSAGLGGIMIPCHSIDITDLVEITDLSEYQRGVSKWIH